MLKSTPSVFVLIKNQSLFMTGILSLLSFLSILILGVAISIGTGVSRWNAQWDLFATVQITNSKNINSVKDILDTNKNKFESVNKISENEMKELLKPWVSNNQNALGKYLPTMYEIEFKKKADMDAIAKQLGTSAKFLPHHTALKTSMDAGWKMILISLMLLGLTIFSIAFCISYITRNTAMLHKRELEILNQVGASDNFVIKQMQTIVTKISGIAGLIGFFTAFPVLLLVISTAHSARIGLMAMMGINALGWTLLLLMPVAIILFANWTTKKTTLKILENS